MHDYMVYHEVGPHAGMIGRWRLALFDGGDEVGGGVFLTEEEAEFEGYKWLDDEYDIKN